MSRALAWMLAGSAGFLVLLRVGLGFESLCPCPSEHLASFVNTYL